MFGIACDMESSFSGKFVLRKVCATESLCYGKFVLRNVCTTECLLRNVCATEYLCYRLFVLQKVCATECFFAESFTVICSFFFIGNQGSEWVKTQVSVGRRRYPFTLEFVAYVGGGDGVIAFDEVNFLNCSLPPKCGDNLNDKFQ